MEGLTDDGRQPSTVIRLPSVIDAFGRSRLLSFDRDPVTRGPTVEVAHEALLREWPRLREWLAESRADVRLQRQLAQAAAEWQNAGCEPSFLLTGARLEQFEGWALATTVALTADERAILDAGLAERDQRATEEQARQRRELEAAHKLAETERQRAEEQTQSAHRLRTRNRLIAAAGSVAFVLAVLTGLFGLQSSRNESIAQANAATAQVASTLALENADIANTEKQNALEAQATAQAEALVRAEAQATAEHAAKIAFARELASAAIANFDVDPERSILLAIEAVSQTYAIDQTALPEAEDALHRAVGASASNSPSLPIQPGLPGSPLARTGHSWRPTFSEAREFGAPLPEKN